MKIDYLVKGKIRSIAISWVKIYKLYNKQSIKLLHIETKYLSIFPFDMRAQLNDI